MTTNLYIEKRHSDSGMKYMTWTAYYQFTRFFGDMSNPRFDTRMRLWMETPLADLMARAAFSWHKMARDYLAAGLKVGVTNYTMLDALPHQWPLHDGMGTMVTVHVEYDVTQLGYEYVLTHRVNGAPTYQYVDVITQKELQNA